LRKTLVDPAIAAHRGRIVKTTGDGMLVEFASAVDAARCAVEVQCDMAAQNADVPQDVRIEFRIGIHVGDIIIDDNDIFGDGVNIAARNTEEYRAPRAVIRYARREFTCNNGHRSSVDDAVECQRSFAAP
jgi:class 3 adenylate cyclase